MFYIGAEGGLNWMLNTTVTGQQTNAGGQLVTVGVSPQIGWAAGGVIGYDFVGPRVELEGVYRQNQTNLSANNFNTNFGTAGTSIGQLGILANLLYDFSPGSTITPYIGAGAGVGFVDGTSSLSSTVFAYQGIIGLGWNVDTNFRVNLDGRYYGTSNPTINGVGWTNSNFSVMLGLQVQVHPVGSGRRAAAAAAAAGAVVHGVLRLGPLEPVGAGSEHDQAGCWRVQDQGLCPHHGDRPYRHVGPGRLQHGAVAASCEHGQGCAGA